MTTATVWAPERRLLTTGLIGLITAAAFEGMAVPTVLPATVQDLGGLDLYGWAFAAFWLTNIVGITLAGSDADRHGPMRSFVLGAVLFCLGLAVSGVATVMPMVIVGRAIQGLGAGGLGSVVYVVIARAYHPSAIPRMLALNSSAWVVPGLVGPALAAQVVAIASWRWVFVGLVPLVAALALLVLVPIRRIGPPAHGNPAAGRRAIAALVLAVGSSLLIGGLGLGLTDLSALGVMGGAAISIFALRELVPEGTLRARAGRPAAIAAVGFVAFAFFGTEAFVPLAVSTVRGAGIVAGGLALSAAAVSWTTGSWIQARLAPRGWRRGLVLCGAVLIAAGIGQAAVGLLPAVPVAVFGLAWATAGLGMGLCYSTLTLVVLESAAPGEEGAASAALQLMFTLGTAVGAGAGGALVALGDRGALPLSRAIGLADGLMLAVILAGLAVIARMPPGVGEQRHETRPPVPASPAGSLAGPGVED